jgi:cobalt/nickel transport system permease protein
MHLANGTIANDVCFATAALAAVAVAYAARRALTTTTPARLARAVLGSGILLAAQMFDVSLPGNFTVHIIGAAFLTLLAGPALAVLGMSAVIVTQALALHDGGITALGVNVLNMAVIAVGASALSFRAFEGRSGSRAGLFAASLVAGAASVAAAIVAMAAELAFSGVPVASVMAVTLPAHAPFAAWEAVTTLVLVLSAAQVRAIKPLAPSSSD